MASEENQPNVGVGTELLGKISMPSALINGVAIYWELTGEAAPRAAAP